MKFKLDENLPELARGNLIDHGHDVHTVAEEALSGATDPAVLDACVREDRILITLDLDFSDIRRYPPGSYPGIWVPRPPRQTFRAINALVQAGIRLLATETARGQLWIIDDRRIRLRHART